VSEEKQIEAQKLTERIHEAVGAKHLSRTDMIIGKDGKIYVLDFNTMPGLTDQSLLPKAVKQSGLSMDKFAQELLRFIVSEITNFLGKYFAGFVGSHGRL
jgi:D-alanine-D-alanine ligase